MPFNCLGRDKKVSRLLSAKRPNLNIFIYLGNGPYSINEYSTIGVEGIDTIRFTLFESFILSVNYLLWNASINYYIVC